MTSLLYTQKYDGLLFGPRREKPDLGVCEQQMPRPACASAQSDQHLLFAYCKESYLDLLHTEFQFFSLSL